MNKKLTPKQCLTKISMLLKNPNWTRSNKIVTGILNKQNLKLQFFSTGMVLSIEVDTSVHRLVQLCLILAVTVEACDDALYIENGKVWLQRRYPDRITEVELDLLLKQQVSLAFLLRNRDIIELHPSPMVGKYA